MKLSMSLPYPGMTITATCLWGLKIHDALDLLWIWVHTLNTVLCSKECEYLSLKFKLNAVQYETFLANI